MKMDFSFVASQPSGLVPLVHACFGKEAGTRHERFGLADKIWDALDMDACIDQGAIDWLAQYTTAKGLDVLFNYREHVRSVQDGDPPEITNVEVIDKHVTLTVTPVMGSYAHTRGVICEVTSTHDTLAGWCADYLTFLTKTIYAHYDHLSIWRPT